MYKIYLEERCYKNFLYRKFYENNWDFFSAEKKNLFEINKIWFNLNNVYKFTFENYKYSIKMNKHVHVSQCIEICSIKYKNF